MNCHEFEGALEGLLEGALAGDDHARCVDHVASCADCRALVAPMGLSLAPLAVEAPASLLIAVLAQTSRAPRRAPWAETWRRWMLRPRFASEVAYVGVVVLSLVSTTVDSRAVLNDLRSEAGILLDRATSLLEKERP
jgi:predicted anti-sigma-YlaC factor YlaD